jgi:hypothetical protein
VVEAAILDGVGVVIERQKMDTLEDPQGADPHPLFSLREGRQVEIL